MLKLGGMWLSKVARRGDKPNVISKNFFRYCVGCEDLYGAWSFGILRKWKGWKPLIRLGFQPLLSSVKFRYFLLFSDMLDCLENSLGLKAHGGSNPSASARALEHYVPRLFSFLSLGHRFHAVAWATTTYHKRFHKSRDYSGLYDFKLITFYVGFSLLTAYQFLICRDSKIGKHVCSPLWC